MSTLFVTDLDGTLLTKEERVSPYSIQKLNSLVDRGMLFTYATARSFLGANRAVKGLSISAPAIYYNGGLVYDTIQNKPLRVVTLNEECKRYVLWVLREHLISPFVCSAFDGQEYVTRIPGGETQGINRYLSRRGGDPRMRSVYTDDELLEGNVFYFKCVGPREQLEKAWNILKYDVRLLCIFHQETYQSDFWMEISAKEANKAQAVSFLRSTLGIGELVCFGDTSNDSDMFDVCDRKYAVQNADGWLKAKATGVIGYCEEDGVAKWLDLNAGV